MKNQAEWWAIPPYKNEGWRIFNEKGELIATFETKEDCMLAVKSFNEKYKTKQMKKVIITGYTAKSEGVILETNIPAKLKPNGMPSKVTFVTWDKIGKLLFGDYTDEVEVKELKELRGQ